MARYTGPKNRLARAVAKDLSLKSNSAKIERRLGVPPGQHGPKGAGRKPSEYRIQLKEKQKVRWMYGIQENQMRRYYTEARKNPKATGTRLLQLLEMRLDNVVYRLGLAPTRTAARQYVSHGHVLVNGKKMDIPSYQARMGDTITLMAKIAETTPVKAAMEKMTTLPKWLEKKAVVGKIVREPEREEIEGDILENLIVEYYSR